MNNTYFDGEDVLTARIPLHDPFEMFMREQWVWLEDACSQHDAAEYRLLDRIYSFLENDVLREELPEELAGLTTEALREEYSKRFPVMMGKALQVIGKQMEEDQIRLKIEYPKHESDES